MTVSRDYIRNAVEAVPRFKLSHLGTPLEEANRLRRTLMEERGQPGGVPRILIKRDDLTGLAFGGNKGRHFEFQTAHILEGSYDTVININDYHSNQARFIAAACARSGLKYHLVSTEKIDRPLNGNLLLCKLMGAVIHRVPADYGKTIAHKIAADVVEDGGKPYIINEQPFPEIMGMIGFQETGLEIESQLMELGLNGPTHFWGLTGRSIAGLRLYAKNRGLPWTATAVKYSPSADDALQEAMVRRSQETAGLLGLPETLEPGDVDVLDGYNGPGYGVPYDGVFEAMHLLGRVESIILDPNYTGKSMAGLLGEIRRGRFSGDETVVFIHSGGLPQVFPFAQDLWKWRDEQTVILGGMA
jgi:1-aminocyclopropane-1-carboxylate deaminase/D-cysteine desulfhydrase-like pyridoxal-dependent ACC family enzyme